MRGSPPARRPGGSSFRSAVREGRPARAGPPARVARLLHGFLHDGFARGLPMTTLLGWSALLVLVFVVCRWGGAQLATHHGDGAEVLAALGVGLSIIGTIAAAPDGGAGLAPTTLALTVAAAGAGLFAGYGRDEPRRRPPRGRRAH